MNPYTLPPAQCVPLRPETLSVIYARALHAAVEEHVYPETVPSHVPIQHLESLRPWVGPDLYTLSMEQCEELFAGMTHPLYQTIFHLYCSKEGRSIGMVWQILQKMAQQTGASPLAYEAVWSTCLALERQRRACLDVRIERNLHTWWIGSLVLPVACDERAFAHRATPLIMYPHLVCLIDLTQKRPLALHLGDGDAQEEYSLVLYEALVASRRLVGSSSQRYVWSFPSTLLVADDQSHLLKACRLCCQHLGIHLERSSEVPAELQTIQQAWERGLQGRTLSRTQCFLLFEASLRRTFRSSPGQDLRPFDPVGSQIDPAYAFPILRLLLPEHEGSVSSTGTVRYKYREYTHPLLSYWANQPVTFHASAFSEKTIWVYWKGETLCQAQSS